METVYISAVKEVTPLPGSDHLAIVSLSRGAESVIPTDAAKVGDRMIWVPSGTYVDRKSPLRKVTKSAWVKNRKILGYTSKGLILSTKIVDLDDEYDEETNICRRLMIVPVPSKEATSFPPVPKIIEGNTEKARTFDSSRNITIFAHDDYTATLAKAGGIDLTHLYDGSIVAVPSGSIFYLFNKSRQVQGELNIFKIPTFENLRIKSEYHPSTVEADSLMIFDVSELHGKFDLERYKDMTAINKLLNERDNMVLTFAYPDKVGNKPVLLGMTDIESGTTYGAEKTYKMINHHRGNKTQFKLFAPLFVMDDIPGYSQLKFRLNNLVQTELKKSPMYADQLKTVNDSIQEHVISGEEDRKIYSKALLTYTWVLAKNCDDVMPYYKFNRLACVSNGKVSASTTGMEKGLVIWQEYKKQQQGLTL